MMFLARALISSRAPERPNPHSLLAPCRRVDEAFKKRSLPRVEARISGLGASGFGPPKLNPEP